MMNRSHILVIDDDPSILETLRLILEQEGDYRVTTSEKLFENLADVEQLHPDLIVLDVRLRGSESGWSFIERLKLYHATANIPILLCTAAHIDTQEHASVLAQTGVALLYKPFEVDDVLQAVSIVLSAQHPDTDPPD